MRKFLRGLMGRYIIFQKLHLSLKKKKKRMSDWEFRKDYHKYKSMNTRESMALKWHFILKMADDKYSGAGNLGDYFWQDLMIARMIYNNDPDIHYDIGSRLGGFIAYLLSFRQDKKTVMIDIRPLPQKIDGLEFIQADATNLDRIASESIDSLSSLHALEHFGLGRYGDPIDPEASFKAMKAMQRVLKFNGMLYLSLPCSKVEKCVFNANRLFNPYTIIHQFDEMELINFYLIKNNGIKKLEIFQMSEDELLNMLDDTRSGNTCIFVFRKRK